MNSGVWIQIFAVDVLERQERTIAWSRATGSTLWRTRDTRNALRRHLWHTFPFRLPRFCSVISHRSRDYVEDVPKSTQRYQIVLITFWEFTWRHVAVVRHVGFTSTRPARQSGRHAPSRLPQHSSVFLSDGYFFQIPCENDVMRELDDVWVHQARKLQKEGVICCCSRWPFAPDRHWQRTLSRE